VHSFGCTLYFRKKANHEKVIIVDFGAGVAARIDAAVYFARQSRRS
jgi:hypothetical protein